jgi:hypothetical protein
MAFTAFDLATLVAVQRKQQTLPRFWANFFTTVITFETESIDFEVVSRRYKKLAPFVAPNVQGRVIDTQGSRVIRFKPAYVKVKSVLDPTKALARVPGEYIYNSLSNEQRRLANLAENLREQRSRIENREEWLAAKAIIDGKVTIEGEDYSPHQVDFGRDPSLTLDLTGNNAWDNAQSNPLKDILEQKRTINKLSGGVVNRIVFGTDAWDAFAIRLGLDNPGIGNLLDTNFRGSETEVSRILNGYEGVEYVGRVRGSSGAGFDAYVYSGGYDDATGANVPLLDTKQVVGIANNFDGVATYGAIMDADAGYRALPIFVKNWRNEDPSVEYVMSQSAPLFVPAEPDSVFLINTGITVV